MSKIEGRSVTYRVGNSNLLEDVSFALSEGEIVSLIGPNGAGKSTLLKCILGIIKPTSGNITLDGRDIQSLSRVSLARHIAYLSQDKKLAWPGKVKNIVALGRFGVDANSTKSSSFKFCVISGFHSETTIPNRKGFAFGIVALS